MDAGGSTPFCASRPRGSLIWRRVVASACKLLRPGECVNPPTSHSSRDAGRWKPVGGEPGPPPSICVTEGPSFALGSSYPEPRLGSVASGALLGGT